MYRETHSTAELIEEARGQIEDVEFEIARLKAIGEDDYEDGSVLVFDKTFDAGHDKVYSYVAIRGGGQWFLTGCDRSARPAFNWPGLWDFIGDDTEVWAVTTLEQVR